MNETDVLARFTFESGRDAPPFWLHLPTADPAEAERFGQLLLLAFGFGTAVVFRGTMCGGDSFAEWCEWFDPGRYAELGMDTRAALHVGLNVDTPQRALELGERMTAHLGVTDATSRPNSWDVSEGMDWGDIVARPCTEPYFLARRTAILAGADDAQAQHAAERAEGVQAALGSLDGSNAAVVSMMTGLSRQDLDDLGGVL